MHVVNYFNIYLQERGLKEKMSTGYVQLYYCIRAKEQHWYLEGQSPVEQDI